MKSDSFGQIHLAAPLLVHFFEQELYDWISVDDGGSVAELPHVKNSPFFIYIAGICKSFCPSKNYGGGPVRGSTAVASTEQLGGFLAIPTFVRNDYQIGNPESDVISCSCCFVFSSTHRPINRSEPHPTASWCKLELVDPTCVLQVPNIFLQ